jgi:ribonuclease P protein component
MESGTPATLKLKRLAGASLSRFHYSISKKKLSRAVDRNRAKRRARAVVTSLRGRIAPGYELTLFLEPAMITLPYADLKAKIVFLLEKARIL